MKRSRRDSQHNGAPDQHNVDSYELEKQRRLRPHEQWAARITALAQDKLSGEEQAEVEQHLKTCKRCSEAYQAYLEVAQLLRLAAPRERLIEERGALYGETLPTRQRLSRVDMPPGLPPKMKAYMEHHVVFPEAPEDTADAATEASDSKET